MLALSESDSADGLNDVPYVAYTLAARVGLYTAAARQLGAVFLAKPVDFTALGRLARDSSS